jgi:predicted metal-binding membrane protein
VLAAPSARARDDPAIRLLVGGSLVILAGLAWAWTVTMAAMPDCHRIPLADFVLMWTVMMAAMMFPALVPVVLAYTAFALGRGTRTVLARLAFVAGYLVVWGALGFPARALLAVGSRPSTASPRSRGRGARSSCCAACTS